MKAIDAQKLEELGKLYLKHSEKKKKLFGGEKVKLNENEFNLEVISINWVKELFDLSFDWIFTADSEHIIIDNIEFVRDYIGLDSEFNGAGYKYDDQYSMIQLGKVTAMLIEKANSEMKELTLEEIEVEAMNSSSDYDYHLKFLLKQKIKFSAVIHDNKEKAQREEVAEKKAEKREKLDKLKKAGGPKPKKGETQEAFDVRVAEYEAHIKAEEIEEVAAAKEAAVMELMEFLLLYMDVDYMESELGIEFVNGIPINLTEDNLKDFGVYDVWQNYKKEELCFDMPIELVRLMKGKEDKKKQSVSKSSGTKTQLFYGKKKSKRGTVSYTLRIDFENSLCSGWTDL